MNQQINKKFWFERNVFITGSTGLLGSWITKYLVDAGANIVVLLRHKIPESFAETFSWVEIVKGRVEEYKTIYDALKKYKIEIVFHLAAQTISPIANKDPLSTFETNIKGTWTVLEACRKSFSVKRILVPSSDKAYGENEPLPYTEESRLQGARPYTVSKTCADLIAQTYHKSFGLPLCITRCGNLFGGGDLLFERLVPSVIRAGFLNKPLVIRSDGKYVRDFFYVEDGAIASIKLIEAMEQSKIVGQAFNFSYENPITVLAMVNKILNNMGSKIQPTILGEPLNEVRNQYLSAKKAHQILDWQPSFTLDEGIEKTIKWYRIFFEHENRITA